jgi:hypothetical protein
LEHLKRIVDEHEGPLAAAVKGPLHAYSQLPSTSACSRLPSLYYQAAMSERRH